MEDKYFYQNYYYILFISIFWTKTTRTCLCFNNNLDYENFPFYSSINIFKFNYL